MRTQGVGLQLARKDTPLLDLACRRRHTRIEQRRLNSQNITCALFGFARCHLFIKQMNMEKRGGKCRLYRQRPPKCWSLIAVMRA